MPPAPGPKPNDVQLVWGYFVMAIVVARRVSADVLDEELEEVLPAGAFIMMLLASNSPDAFCCKELTVREGMVLRNLRGPATLRLEM